MFDSQLKLTEDNTSEPENNQKGIIIIKSWNTKNEKYKLKYDLWNIFKSQTQRICELKEIWENKTVQKDIIWELF